MQAQFLRLPEVLKVIPVKKTALYAWVKAGQFPAPVQLGGRSVAWRVADVEAWAASRESTRPVSQ